MRKGSFNLECNRPGETISYDGFSGGRRINNVDSEAWVGRGSTPGGKQAPNERGKDFSITS